MTVYVKADNIRLWLPVPLSAFWLLSLVPGKFTPEMGFGEEETALELYRALKLARRDFGKLELVHVRSADGEEVIIKL